jgi:tetratricopeptide (TPR) repeat protein
VVCGNCGRTRKGGPQAAGCRCIPAGFWQRPDIASALAKKDANFLLTRFWECAGLSQEAVARLAGLDQSVVSRIVNGARNVPAAKIPEVLAGLGAPGYTAGMPADTRARSAPNRGRPRRAAAPALLNESEADPTGARASVELIDGLADSADDLVLDMLEDEVRRVASAYVHEPLPRLVPQFIALRSDALAYHRAGARPARARRLLVVVASVTLLLAHAAQNLGDHRAAVAHLAAARRCAEHAEHAQLLSWALGSAALFAEWRPRLDAALDHAAHSAAITATGHTAIRATAIEARAAARAGDRERALAALDRIQRLRERSTAADDVGTTVGGLFAFSPAKQAFYAGTVHLLLGDPQSAAHHSTTAIRLYSTGPEHERSYGDAALARADLVSARLRQGDIDGAEQELDHLLSLPPEQRIRQLRPAVADLHRTLTGPGRDRGRKAAGMADRLRTFTVLDTGLPEPPLPLGR